MAEGKVDQATDGRIVEAPRGYVFTNDRGTLGRETPKVKGKAAVKAAKRARQRKAALRRGNWDTIPS